MDAVVVTHNSALDLAGLLACEPLREAFDRIIVVDNASQDDSRELARQAGAHLIAREENDGFGAGANVGARHARGPYFALLNPDIRFASADVLTDLEDAFDDPRIGLVAPRLILPDGSVQDSARDVPTPLALFRRRWTTSNKHGAIFCDHACEVPWLVGACAVIRRTAFDAISGFDERFFLYFEDVDLCVRLREAGWSVRLDPTVSALHQHRAASRARLLSWATRQHVRSAMRFFAYHPHFIVQSLVPHRRQRFELSHRSSTDSAGATTEVAVRESVESR